MGPKTLTQQCANSDPPLVETNVDGVKTIFGCSGTIYETAAGASGYCFAFDVASNKMTAMLALTAGEGAGVWMAGQGAAADPEGNLYVITGNGDFDGVSQWGESFLKLKYTPPSSGATAKLQVAGHWTPWTDRGRTQRQRAGADKMAGMSAPSEAIKPVGGGMNMSLKNARLAAMVNDQGVPTLLVYPNMANGAWADEDWGSAGPACIFPLAFASQRARMESPIRSRQQTWATRRSRILSIQKRTARSSQRLQSG